MTAGLATIIGAPLLIMFFVDPEQAKGRLVSLLWGLGVYCLVIFPAVVIYNYRKGDEW